MQYGYCRISTSKQKIERQERNILSLYPNAIIVKEVYTGTKKTGRAAFLSILNRVKTGDTIIFDSVSRMSRNADEGIELYFDLYSKGIELVFLKEPYINTETYRKDIEQQHIQRTGEDVDIILEAVEQYLRKLAERQIRLAFEQSEKEVTDLHQRTSEGVETARRKGKQIGQKSGSRLKIRKAAAAKEVIKTHSKTFGGTLSDKECMKLAGISDKTYYKYKAELKANNNYNDEEPLTGQLSFQMKGSEK